jgi:protein-S-isoprenylcysteine O-methyltransferase Ste14
MTRRVGMWIRGIIGILLVVAGVVFILQGANVLHGSMMSGHGGYAVLGAVVLLIGAALLVWTWRRRGAAGG